MKNAITLFLFNLGYSQQIIWPCGLFRHGCPLNRATMNLLIGRISSLKHIQNLLWREVPDTLAELFASYLGQLGTYIGPNSRLLNIKPVEMKGRVPARSVVIPGSYTKEFPAGEFQVPCALIIGSRKESTNKKTSLNDALREYSVAV